MEFESLEERRVPGTFRRFLTTCRHLAGLLLGAVVARVRDDGRRDPRPGATARALRRVAAGVAWLFVDKKLVREPFPVQLRRRLERLGPTYIKLGQILSVREDLLPPGVTSELQQLLDRAPAVSHERFVELVTNGLGRPAYDAFSWIAREPLGSASIAQAHRATTRDGLSVILKVVKPGIRETLRRDGTLLRISGRILQLFFARYQPRRVIDEFVSYTSREADLRREADNAETFRANFRDAGDIVFPAIHRQYSGETVLCMEFLSGIKPTDPQAARLSASQRARLIDPGASAIIRMLYRDGFFHADLHPANLLILAGPRAAFIDLGMVGRFEPRLRRTLLYYFHCVVTGNAADAARYLCDVAEAGPGADPSGFRREVEQVSLRWARGAAPGGPSLGRLIVESVGMAARHRMYFPVEMVLMGKALLTFESVGRSLSADFDVMAVSRSHVRKIFLSRFHPANLAQEGLRSAPELVDALLQAPLLVREGLRFLERNAQSAPERPLAGARGAILSGACVIAAATTASLGGPWPLWLGLFIAAAALALRRSR